MTRCSPGARSCNTACIAAQPEENTAALAPPDDPLLGASGRLPIHFEFQLIGLHQPRGLFQPFGAETRPGTAGERSTGLGLAIARKMVEAHGGKIWVTSELGVGSCFLVALPLDERRGVGHVAPDGIQ